MKVASGLPLIRVLILVQPKWLTAWPSYYLILIGSVYFWLSLDETSPATILTLRIAGGIICLVGLALLTYFTVLFLKSHDVRVVRPGETISVKAE